MRPKQTAEHQDTANETLDIWGLLCLGKIILNVTRLSFPHSSQTLQAHHLKWKGQGKMEN